MNLLNLRCILIAVLSIIAVSQASTQPARPNVVMIFTDDMGYSDISSFSNVDLPVTTPNIDRLATEGMKFTQFYVSMPICSPSRAAVLSGRFSPENGLTDFLQFRVGNNESSQNDYMNPQMSHLPKAFQSAGYATAHVGKWHLGGGRDVDDAPSIRQYGYDEAYSTWESPNPDPGLGIRFAPWDPVNSEPGQVPRYDRTKYMVDKTLDFMTRKQSQPTFVTLWPDDLHTPFVPTPAMVAKYNGTTDGASSRANFYGVLEEYDRQMGRLLDGLQSRGLAENTIIFFTGDNGPSPDFGTERTNGMNGRKLSLHEGGIRQPFLIRWPGRIPAGSMNNQTVLSSVDLLPTLTALAGIPMPAGSDVGLDGENLSAAMLGTPVTRTNPLFWEYGRNSSVPRPGVNMADWSPPLAIREGDLKLLLNFNNTGHELYNVRTDPNESNNLAASQPAVVQSMAAKAIAWRNTLPARTQPYPAFSTVNFQQYGITRLVSAEALRSASGAASTARIDGVAAAPNGIYDEIYVIHTDAAEKETFLRLNPATTQISRITDSDRILTALGVAPSVGLTLRGGFDYSPPGDRLFFTEDQLALQDQAVLFKIDVGTTQSSIVLRSTVIDGISDHSVLPSGHIAAVLGVDGNRTMGSIVPSTASWNQRATQASMLSAAPGTTNLIPESIAVNSSTGLAYVFAHGDGELFRISNFDSAPVFARQAEAVFASADLHDMAVDQAGNFYGYDVVGQQIIAMRAGDSAINTISLAAIGAALGKPGPFALTPWRGMAARMADNTHSDLFLAGASPDDGVVRIRFGNYPAAVNNWSLY